MKEINREDLKKIEGGFWGAFIAGVIIEGIINWEETMSTAKSTYESTRPQ